MPVSLEALQINKRREELYLFCNYIVVFMLPRITVLVMTVSSAGAAILPSVNPGRELQLELYVTSWPTSTDWRCSRGLEGQTVNQDFMALPQALHWPLLSEHSLKIRGHQRPSKSELFLTIQVPEVTLVCIFKKPGKPLERISSHIQLDLCRT